MDLKGSNPLISTNGKSPVIAGKTSSYGAFPVLCEVHENTSKYIKQREKVCQKLCQFFICQSRFFQSRFQSQNYGQRLVKKYTCRTGIPAKRV